jgi:hypothetical protein
MVLKTETDGDFHIPMLQLEASKKRAIYSSVALKKDYMQFDLSPHPDSNKIFHQIKDLYETRMSSKLQKIEDHPGVQVGVRLKGRTQNNENLTPSHQQSLQKLSIVDHLRIPFDSEKGLEFNGLSLHLDFSSICGDEFKEIPVETEIPLYALKHSRGDRGHLENANKKNERNAGYGAEADPHQGLKVSKFRFFLRLTHDLINNNGNVEERREERRGLKDADRSQLLIGVRFEPSSIFGQDVVLPEIGAYLKTGNVTPVLHEARANPGNAEKHYAAGIKLKTPIHGLRLHASTGRTSVSRPNDNRDGYYLFFSVGASYELKNIGYVQVELQPGPLKDHRQEGLSPTFAVLRARVGPVSLFTQVTSKGKHENNDYGHFISPRLTFYPFRKGFFRYFFVSGGWRHEPYPYPLEGPTPAPRDVYDLNVFFIALGLGHSGYALDR